MAWYSKYLSIYEKPFSDVPDEVVVSIRSRLAAMQSEEPLVSIATAIATTLGVTSCMGANVYL